MATTGIILVSCEDGNFSGGSGGYNPLDTAGGTINTGPQVVDAGGFQPGEFVKTAIPNTGFFKDRPEGEATADKLLDMNTPLKVVSDDGSWVKVELDSGETGYVSTVQVLGENESVVVPGIDGQADLYSPTGDIIPLDDPDLPSEEDMVVPPTIDPDAPVEEPILPDNSGEASEADTPALPDPITEEQLEESSNTAEEDE